VVMNGGRIEQAGTPVELYRRPRTPFVAQFLGHPNFLFGEVVERGADHVTVRVGADVVRARAEVSLERGAPVAVVLRPSSARLSRERPPDAVNAVRGRIGYTVYLGTSAEYEVRLGHAAALRAVEQISTGIPSFRDGEDVVVSWSADDTLVFPGTEASFRGVVA